MSRQTARVLVIGLGGLGSPASLALAAAGVGTLGLVDDDPVEVSNLHRQILYGEADVGTPKVEAAARALLRHAPNASVEAHRTRFLPENALALLRGYDLVVEGSDNFATKFLVADSCVIANVPVIHAAAVRWVGTVLAAGARGRPCYRCLFEDLPEGDAPNCAEAGVMGPVVGMVGAVLADLALASLDGRDPWGTLFRYDGRTDASRRTKISPRESCALCGLAPTIATVDRERYVSAACT